MTIFDKAVALERLEGDLDLLCELVQIFLDETPRLANALAEALATGDAKKVQQAAHSIKGSAANLGAMALFEQAQRIELLAREEDLERGEAEYAALQLELRRLETELSRLG
jgi:two-component system sensor histidine kinase/response regulator